MSENVVILGATSGIARPLCRLMAARGCRLILAGRNSEELNRLAADLKIRSQREMFVEQFEATDFAGHRAFVARCLQRFEGELTGVVLCYGQLPDQQTSETDWDTLRETLDVNLCSPISVLNLFASELEQRGGGYLAALSSVAGDRGRQSNYTYGAAKAGLSAYLQGLRNRLHRAGVQVLTIKPGQVDTPMTAGIVNPNSPLVASAQRVARDIDRAIRKRKNVLYTPWYWWPIMKVITSLPESLFKRLKL